VTAYIGIDPGLDGGIAYLPRPGGGHGIHIHDMPTVQIGTKRMVDTSELRDMLIAYGNATLVMVEDVNAGAVKSVMSAFSFGRGYGRIEGLLVALDRPHDYVSSPTWTKAIGITRGAKKDEHIAVAKRLFPQFGALTDGMADALLIAEYGRRLHTGRVAA
jgi:hypothetical protein